jgi:hypothetical protein
MSDQQKTTAWAAFFEDRLAGEGVWRRPPIFATKKDAQQWARDTAFRIARVRIEEIKEGRE